MQTARLISSMKKYEENDPHLSDMNSKLKKFDLNDEKKSDLYFALGKAYEDLKKYDQSFSFYDSGNKILKKLNHFDLYEEKIALIKLKTFSNAN